jgi:poly(hydroxyalkanoate) granule-associated protein
VEAAEKIKDSAQQIWLAGLGAFAKAQQEGGKVFESLVADGLNLQRKTQATAQAQMAEASQKIGSLTGGLSSRAGQQWDRLEGIFEDRVARALERLNMASRADLDALQQRLDALELQVRALRQVSPSAQRPARAKSHPAAQSPARTAKRGKSAG